MRLGGPHNANEFMAHYYNQAKNRPHPKDVAVNNRCGNEIGDFITPEYSVAPDIVADKWEATRGIGRSFGFNADEAERVLALGSWLDTNGAAIYGTTYWNHAEDPDSNVPVRYTVRDNTLYATALAWPGQELTLSGGLPFAKGTRVSLLGNRDRGLRWRRDGDVIRVRTPDKHADQHAYVFRIENPGLAHLPRAELTIPPISRAGEPFQTTVTVTNHATTRSRGVRVTLPVPAGWSVSPARTDTGPIPAGTSVDVDFTVTPPAGTPAAGYEIAASVSAGRVSYRTAPHRVLVGYDNTAPGTPATQKSTGYGGDAGRAIDGNTDGHFGHGSVTHTVEPEKQAWWQTDLGTSTDIGAVTLWNRTDCCSGRLKDYYVLVSDEPFTSDSLEETLATPGVRAYHQSAEAGRPTHIPIAETGRYVRIQLKSASDALSLAEVAVYTPVP